MPRGGRQPGAGRPKGSKNKRTIALEEAMAEGGELPKGFMLRIMRDESQPLSLRADMAKAVAPYCHPRLNAIEHRDENGAHFVIVISEADSKL